MMMILSPAGGPLEGLAHGVPTELLMESSTAALHDAAISDLMTSEPVSSDPMTFNAVTSDRKNSKPR